VGLVVGYVSERHVLIIVLCGLYWAVWALLQWPRRWSWQARGSKIEDRGSREEERESRIEDGGSMPPKPISILDLPSSILRPRSSILSCAILVALMLACLPMSLQPLHANQVGHREAGLWLKEHSRPGDIVVDPFNWAYFYAGRVFEEGSDSHPLPCQHSMRYVVLELTRKQHAELTMLPLAKELAEGGQVVYDWQPNRNQLKHKAQEVQIFAVPIPSQ